MEKILNTIRRQTVCMNAALNQPKLKGTVTIQPIEAYEALTRQPELKALVDQIRQTADRKERTGLKAMLPFRCPHYFSFEGDRRRQDCIKAEEFTFQTCIDIDDLAQCDTALERAMSLDRQADSRWHHHLLHAERSASGKLHLDIRIPVGLTIEEAQTQYCQQLGIAFDPDCCTPERMIYITDHDSQIYTSQDWCARLSDEELEERREAYRLRGLGPDGRATSAIKTTAQTQATSGLKPSTAMPSTAMPSAAMPSGATDYPTEYRGIPYPMLVDELCEQMGGQPEHGSRNDFIFAMACHLRHVCNDDPQWIRRVLPNYGEDQARADATIVSACQRQQSPSMTRKMQTAIDLCLKRQEAAAPQEAKAQMLAIEPKFEGKMPALIRLLTQKAPEMYRPAIASQVFPALGMLMSGVRFEYWDNTEMEPALMSLLVAEFSGGKSAVKAPIGMIIEDVEKQSDENRQQLKEWRDEVNRRGANKDKPQRPEGLPIQVASANMTNAAFVDLLDNNQRAGNKRMYTNMEEVEQLKKIGGGSMVDASEIIRHAFDTDLYGQERVSAQAVTARAWMRWNITASTTPGTAVKMFGNQISNGTLSRLDICTIIEDKSIDFPVFGKYDDRMRQQLKPYLERLEKASGLIVCQQAKRVAKELCLEAKEYACLADDESYERLARRAAVIAFRKAMILYVASGERWSKDIEQFMRWSFRYDLWCKMRYFGQTMRQQLEQERRIVSRGRPNMLDLMADRFTEAQLVSVRRREGLDPSVGNYLAQQKRRGFIVRDEVSGEWVKTEHYLKKHPSAIAA